MSPVTSGAKRHLTGRVIVVTGAASGFGRLVCVKSAERGARVFASDITVRASGDPSLL